MKTDKPNIILILNDQHQAATFDSDNPCRLDHLQELRKDSLWFCNAHAANPVCSPARASLFSGLLPHNHGMVDCTHTVPEYRSNYDASRDTLSRLLKREGYHSAYYGKWHVERSYKLENYGFDEYETEFDLPKFQTTVYEKYVIQTEGYNDQTLFAVQNENETQTEEYYIYNRAIDFIERNRNSEDPYFVTISAYAPHDPYTVPRDIYEQYPLDKIRLPESFNDDLSGRPAIYRRIQKVFDSMTPEDVKKAIACYYGYCTLVDRQIGRLVQYLKETGQYENTIIVFTSDHGDALGAHGVFCKGIYSFEETYRIPLLIKAPGLPTGESDIFIGTHDIAPTLLELAGLPPLEGEIDGSSVMDYVRGTDRNQRIGFAEYFGVRMFCTQRLVWKDKYKYVFNGFDYDELYNLADDPHELRNLAGDPEYEDVIKDMAKEMWKIVKRTGDYALYQSDYYLYRIAPIGPEMPKKPDLYNKIV